jgi:hypothetical protein
MLDRSPREPERFELRVAVDVVLALGDLQRG